MKIRSYKFRKFYDVWLFTSLNGDYSDSPKVLSERFYKLYPDMKQTWIAASEKLKMLPDYIVGISKDIMVDKI